MARQLGMSVSRAQEEISSSEFAEWMAFEAISPGNPEREDFRTALICYYLHRPYLSKADQIKQRLTDYLPKFNVEKEEEISDEEQGKINRRNLLMMFGGDECQ